MKRGDRCAVWVVSGAFLLSLAAAALFSPPLFQFGYQPVSPGPVTMERILQTNLNDASKEDFCLLPGIGEKRAEAIVQYRKKHGAFESIEELACVDGISAEQVETLRAYLRLG